LFFNILQAGTHDAAVAYLGFPLMVSVDASFGKATDLYHGKLAASEVLKDEVIAVWIWSWPFYINVSFHSKWLR